MIGPLPSKVISDGSRPKWGTAIRSPTRFLHRGPQRLSSRTFTVISGLRALTSARSFLHSSALSIGDSALSNCRLMDSMRSSRFSSSSVTATCWRSASPLPRKNRIRVCRSGHQGLQVKCQLRLSWTACWRLVKDMHRATYGVPSGTRRLKAKLEVAPFVRTGFQVS